MLDKALAAVLEEEAGAQVVEVGGEGAVLLPAPADGLHPLDGLVGTAEMAVAVEGVGELGDLRRVDGIRQVGGRQAVGRQLVHGRQRIRRGGSRSAPCPRAQWRSWRTVIPLGRRDFDGRYSTRQM